MARWLVIRSIASIFAWRPSSSKLRSVNPESGDFKSDEFGQKTQKQSMSKKSINGEAKPSITDLPEIRVDDEAQRDEVQSRGDVELEQEGEEGEEEEGEEQDNQDNEQEEPDPVSMKKGGMELKGWERVRVLIPKILAYGRSEGILPPQSVDVGAAQAGFSKLIAEAQREINAHGDRVNVTADISSIHQAIPFLPVPAAILCFIANFFLPGSGRALASFFVNAVVAGMQFITITLFLVGWFWSIAWGGLIIIRSVQFRDALAERRKEAVAIAAIEALTKDSVLHRRDVKKMVKEKHKTRG